jgi:hypothetical protein
MINFSKLCTPAKIYFAIAVIATIFDLFNGASFMFAFWKMIFAFVWTFILGGLCDKGYKSISWVLVLLPYILMFLASLNIYHVTDEQRQLMRSIQLQGAYGQEAFTEGAVSGNADQNALKTLSQSEIDMAVKDDYPGMNGSTIRAFKDVIKKWNKDSLNSVKSGLDSEIARLTIDFNNATAARGPDAFNLGKTIGRQKAKLNAIKNEINIRP